MSEQVKEEIKAVIKEEEQLVSAEAYKKAQEDMHNFKKKASDLELRLNQIQADKEAAEQATLIEKEDWRKLYSKAEEKLRAIESERANEQIKFIESHKINAVLQSLGGFKKNEYNKFVDTKNVQVKDDGSIDTDSVMNEVSRIKKEFPELLKMKDVSALPSEAPRSFANKSVKDMTPLELQEARRAALSKF